MEPNIEQVKTLRNSTGCSPSDAKKALKLNNCDINVAMDWLRKEGITKADKVTGKTTIQGRIATDTDEDTVAMIEVLTETDFAAMSPFFIEKVQSIAHQYANEDQIDNELVKEISLRTKETTILGRKLLIKEDPKSFGIYVHSNAKLGVLVGFNKNVDQVLAKDIAMHIAATSPMVISRDNISNEWIEKETAIAKDVAQKSGKPATIVDKIVTGQINALMKEKCLVEQPFVKDSKTTVGQLLEKNGLKVLEFTRWQIGE